MLPVSILASIAVVVVVVMGGQGGDPPPDCTNSPTLRQRHELECPPRAVCGDEWHTIRDWYNGTRCSERRVVVNCECPGHRQCPIGEQQHLFYANQKHRQYLCEPKCSVGLCSTRFRAAEEMVQHSPDFGRHNFYRINCRCPGHDFPMTTRRGYLTRATSYSRLRFNFTQSIVYVQYRCSPRMPLTGEDPCDSQMYLG